MGGRHGAGAAVGAGSAHALLARGGERREEGSDKVPRRALVRASPRRPPGAGVQNGVVLGDEAGEGDHDLDLALLLHRYGGPHRRVQRPRRRVRRVHQHWPLPALRGRQRDADGDPVGGQPRQPHHLRVRHRRHHRHNPLFGAKRQLRQHLGRRVRQQADENDVRLVHHRLVVRRHRHPLREPRLQRSRLLRIARRHRHLRRPPPACGAGQCTGCAPVSRAARRPLRARRLFPRLICRAVRRGAAFTPSLQKPAATQHVIWAGKRRAGSEGRSSRRATQLPSRPPHLAAAQESKPRFRRKICRHRVSGECGACRAGRVVPCLPFDLRRSRRM